ncbi:MAG: type I 3-dehydroquinate dehydratase [Chloroflexi bacterium]|nr:type I 3-dehydroquinate dehydratase [Chloroflexota bacterium]
MKRPKICAVITGNDFPAARTVAELVDMFEMRLDLSEDGWEEWVGRLGKPWIACNRRADEGGKWAGSEEARIEKLLRAVELGAAIIDIELATGGLAELVDRLKPKVKCLISYHNLTETPSLTSMKEIVQQELAAGADICKVVTTARRFEDNLAMLRLIAAFPGIRMVCFAMGSLGVTSRVLCPLAGGDFTYASIEHGRESAAGQMTAADLRNIYEMTKNGQ